VEARFSAPVQTGPGAHPASCTMGTGSFPGVKSGRGVMLTTHPLLVPWSRKGRAIPLLPLWAIQPVQSLSACTRVHFTGFFFYPPYWRLFLHLQPEVAPCHGDRVLLIMGSWPCSPIKSVSMGRGSICPCLFLCMLLVLMQVVLTELPFKVICCCSSAENAASFICCSRWTACCLIIVLTELFTAL